jgi:hypothetical protein
MAVAVRGLPCGKRESSDNVARFPPPWTVEETDACLIVKDHTGHSLAYVYFEDEPGHRCD